MKRLLLLVAATFAVAAPATAQPTPPEGTLYACAAGGTGCTESPFKAGQEIDLVAFYNAAAEKKKPWADYECRQEGWLVQYAADLFFAPLEEKKADGKFTTYSSDVFITISKPSKCWAILGVPAKERYVTEVLSTVRFEVTP